MENSTGRKGACNWCVGTPREFAFFESFQDVLFHAIWDHLQDPDFRPTATCKIELPKSIREAAKLDSM